MSYVYICVFTVDLIFFVVGYALTWTSPVLPKLQESKTNPFSNDVTAEEISWISSLLPLGAVFGPFIFGFLADKIGRKWTLFILGVPFAVSFPLMAFGKAVFIYYFARFISGLAMGGVFTVVPMYLGEISEPSNRGAIGSSLNVFICFGLFFSYIIGPFIPMMAFNLLLSVFPGLYLVLLVLLVPESPHYFVAKEKHEQAKKALEKIRGTGNPVIETELSEIQAKIKEEGHGTFFDIFKSKGLIKAFIISLSLVAFQQLSGINVVLFYAQSLFEAAGTTLEPAYCSIIIGATQFSTSFVTPLMSDRLGRKFLLLFSGIGMLLSEVPLGAYSYLKDHGTDVSQVSFVPIACLMAYIITYNVGFGPLPWAIMGEIFPSNVKSIASASTAGFCWILGFFITKYFQAVADAIGMGPSFWVFSVFCFIAIPFSKFYIIETKGKSLAEIQEILNS